MKRNKNYKRLCVLVLIFCLSVCMPDSRYCQARTGLKLKYVKTINGKQVKYKNQTGVNEFSDNGEFGGKTKSKKIAKDAKFFWYYSKNSGGIRYKKISKSLFVKRVKKTNGQVCTFLLKNGKIKAIYAEYQA